MAEILTSKSKVSEVVLDGFEGMFRFDGAPEELSDVLSHLTAGGVRVLSFGEIKQTVEDLYLKLSHHEVM